MAIEIDGSIGGGSVLRVAVPLAMGMNREIILTNIRKERSKPGLRTQHLLGINALAKLGNYTVMGNHIGSDMVRFSPSKNGSIESEINIEIDTAASVSLIFQAISNYCISSKRKVRVHFNGGGTHTKWSPSFEYLKYAFSPVLNKIGIRSSINVENYGFYPKGGAKGSFEIDAQEDVTVFDLIEPGDLTEICIYSLCSEKLKQANVAERMISTINLNQGFQKHVNYVPSFDPGASLTTVLKFSNGVHKGIGILGEKGLKSEDIGNKMQREILQHLKSSWVDEHMADQLLLPLVFGPSGSQYGYNKHTDHVSANIEIIEQIYGKIFRIEEENQGFIIKRR